MTELDKRIEKRRGARNYRPRVAEQETAQTVVVPAPQVSVSSPQVNVESKPIDLSTVIKAIDTGLERLGEQLKSEISKPRKVVVDKDGEPIGTIQVESL